MNMRQVYVIVSVGVILCIYHYSIRYMLYIISIKHVLNIMHILDIKYTQLCFKSMTFFNS